MLVSKLIHAGKKDPMHFKDIACKNLTLNIWGHGHVWGQNSRSISPLIPEKQLSRPWKSSSRSQSGRNIPLITSFCFTSISPPIPEKQLFQNLTLKITSSRTHSGCNILLTHIPFVPCQSTHSSLRNSYFKIWPWKSSSRSHSGCIILLTHIPSIPCQSARPGFLRKSYSKTPLFSNLTLKIQIQDQGHGWGTGSYILWTNILFIMFQLILHSWDTAI